MNRFVELCGRSGLPDPEIQELLSISRETLCDYRGGLKEPSTREVQVLNGMALCFAARNAKVIADSRSSNTLATSCMIKLGKSAPAQQHRTKKKPGSLPTTRTRPVSVKLLRSSREHTKASRLAPRDDPGRSKNKSFSVVSMFSGCGGMDLGFLGGFEFLGKYYAPNPFKVIWANDFNPFACATYAENIGPHIRLGDVWEQMEFLPIRADVLIGGFPCQDISINGKGLGVRGKRSGLYRAMVEGIRRVKPKVFIAENVKGLLMKHNRESLKAILRDFEALDYDVTYSLYRAADFGVPQNRERVLIVGTSKNIKKFEAAKAPLRQSQWISSSAAISDLEHLPLDKSINHIWSVANRSPDQGGRVLHPDRPAQTIRAECHGNIQFHYRLPRRISMREAARFQSFPDTFIFHAKLRETERQIGNAVPPVLAWHVAQAIAACLADPD